LDEFPSFSKDPATAFQALPPSPSSRDFKQFIRGLTRSWPLAQRWVNRPPPPCRVIPAAAKAVSVIKA
jgi:hypothetical protein